ncbi:iron-siderophore ABC transporter substrate-binding protein [Pseudonocardia hispaniensis]|uniref:Iron-siderophore ABC transporter substrate-binding protein n=1 Tax=Pseudonocardia hispaniensis TaxID=904933 RepID=A0ABW1IY96_9PSEU
MFPTRTARRGLGAALALLLALALAACGGGDPKADATATPRTGTFPVTVEHKYGSTTIPAQPQRIVTLGLSDQDAVLALGRKPVGAVAWFGEEPFGTWPWVRTLWGDSPPTVVGERDEYNIEQIAALKPDLILAQYSGMSQAQYDRLSAIAPVVAQPKGFEDYQAPWQDMTRAIGRALGQEQRADELIKGIAERFATIRAEHPEFAGMTAVVAENYEPGQYTAFSPKDPKMIFMSELGFTMPQALQQFIGTKNLIDFSAERLDLLEADRLMWLTGDAQTEQRIKADPLYQRLRVAAEHRDLFVPYDEPPIGAALSFNTVLSIPYAADQLVAQLAAAGKQ